MLSGEGTEYSLAHQGSWHAPKELRELSELTEILDGLDELLVEEVIGEHYRSARAQTRLFDEPGAQLEQLWRCRLQERLWPVRMVLGAHSERAGDVGRPCRVIGTQTRLLERAQLDRGARNRKAGLWSRGRLAAAGVAGSSQLALRSWHR